MNVPILRVARPSDDLNGLLQFYCDGLGLMVLCRFENHAGFDGLMLGREGAPYHFEFTKKHGHVAGRASTSDELLVFYIPKFPIGILRSEECRTPALHQSIP